MEGKIYCVYNYNNMAFLFYACHWNKNGNQWKTTILRTEKLFRYIKNSKLKYIWIISYMSIAKYLLCFSRRNHTNVRNVQNHFRRRVTWRVTRMCIMDCGRLDVTFAVAVSANQPTWRIICCFISVDAPIRNTSSLSLTSDWMLICYYFI